jgi:hypothetical protein
MYVTVLCIVILEYMIACMHSLDSSQSRCAYWSGGACNGIDQWLRVLRNGGDVVGHGFVDPIGSQVHCCGREPGVLQQSDDLKPEPRSTADAVHEYEVLGRVGLSTTTTTTFVKAVQVLSAMSVTINY